MANLVGPRPNPRRRLRELLDAPDLVVAPGAYDGLSARLVEHGGFNAVYMTGFGTSATLLGRPDVGLLTQTEMVDNARRIAQAVDVPVIADADTGYGNPVNVIRTVREYEQAGVAALQLEDQVAPKRCGHMSGKTVVSVEDMCAKIAAAATARHDPDLVIIARTDAAETQGIAAAIQRAKRFRDAGADVLFVEAPRTTEDIETVAAELAGHPLLFNWVEGGKDTTAIAEAAPAAGLPPRDLPGQHPVGGHRSDERRTGHHQPHGDLDRTHPADSILRRLPRPDRRFRDARAGTTLHVVAASSSHRLNRSPCPRGSGT